MYVQAYQSLLIQSRLCAGRVLQCLDECGRQSYQERKEECRISGEVLEDLFVEFLV